MLPTEPLKIDFRRLAVVFSVAGAAADPAGRVLEISMKDPSIHCFCGVRASAACWGYSRTCAKGEKPGLEGGRRE
ncbi:hypothetical protein PFL02_19040 [Pseudomonas fluorescens]|nr:hypothetical protein PFL02_19040 [Pseudomonas fluorescens]